MVQPVLFTLYNIKPGSDTRVFTVHRYATAESQPLALVFLDQPPDSWRKGRYNFIQALGCNQYW